MPIFDATHYNPPAPVAQVILRDAATEARVPNVNLLIDTGADITLLPRAAVEQLGVKIADKEYELIGFDGSRSVAKAVELDMIFLGKAFRGRYLLTEGEHGVLGRDVLCSVVLLFDGPKQEWSAPSP